MLLHSGIVAVSALELLLLVAGTPDVWAGEGFSYEDQEEVSLIQVFRREAKVEQLALSKLEEQEQAKAQAAVLAAEKKKATAQAALAAAKNEQEKIAAQALLTEAKADWLSHQRIPHILHRVLLPSGETGHGNCNHAHWGAYHRLFHRLNPGWQEWVWGESEIYALLEKLERGDFRGHPLLHNFTAVFSNLKPWVKQKDIVPYLVLYAFGGLFLDHDMKCLRPLNSILDGADLVLRRQGDAGFLVNFMAAKPGKKLWLEQLSAVANISNNVPEAEHLGPCSHTGQFVLREVHKRLVLANESFEGMREINDTHMGTANSSTMVHDAEDSHLYAEATSADSQTKFCYHAPWATWAKEWYSHDYENKTKTQKPIRRSFTREEGFRHLLSDCPLLFSGSVYGENLREIGRF